jgi:hypothetical protein
MEFQPEQEKSCKFTSHRNMFVLCGVITISTIRWLIHMSDKNKQHYKILYAQVIQVEEGTKEGREHMIKKRD